MPLRGSARIADVTAPLIDLPGLDGLRNALAPYTVDGVHDLLGDVVDERTARAALHPLDLEPGDAVSATLLHDAGKLPGSVPWAQRYAAWLDRRDDQALLGSRLRVADGVPLAAALVVLAGALEAAMQELAASLLPVVRDLVSRGFREPGAQS
jgi:hypothetical protein